MVRYNFVRLYFRVNTFIHPALHGAGPLKRRVIFRFRSRKFFSFILLVTYDLYYFLFFSLLKLLLDGSQASELIFYFIHIFLSLFFTFTFESLLNFPGFLFYIFFFHIIVLFSKSLF